MELKIRTQSTKGSTLHFQIKKEVKQMARRAIMKKIKTPVIWEKA